MERTKQRTKIKESTGERIFTGVIYAILILFCAIIVFPLLPVSYTHLNRRTRL